MSIDTKALRERLAEFNFISGQECGYNCGAEMKPATDGEYVLAEAAYERMNSAADRLAAIERLSETGTAQAFAALSDDMKLRWFIITGQRDKWARDRLAELEAESEHLRRILAAVETKETSFDCPHRFNDVDGLNWFDAQRKALTAGEENE